jgi:hypothetical protein
MDLLLSAILLLAAVVPPVWMITYYCFKARAAQIRKQQLFKNALLAYVLAFGATTIYCKVKCDQDTIQALRRAEQNRQNA